MHTHYNPYSSAPLEYNFSNTLLGKLLLGAFFIAILFLGLVDRIGTESFQIQAEELKNRPVEKLTPYEPGFSIHVNYTPSTQACNVSTQCGISQ